MVTVFFSMPASLSHSDRVEKISSSGMPAAKPSSSIVKARRSEYTENFLKNEGFVCIFLGLETVFHHDLAGQFVAVHGKAHFQQGFEHVLHHLRIAANHKAAVGRCERALEGLRQTAVFQ